MRRVRSVPAARGLLWVLCAFVLLAAGCGAERADAPRGAAAFASFTDDMGRAVTLAKKPERIVVSSASFLEPLHAVGGDVVGRPDSRTQMQPFARDKASVGRVYHIDLEKVLACAPDFVLLNKGMNEKLVEPLEANGIACAVVQMKSYEDVKRTVALFALATGETAKGEAVVRAMEDRIAAVAARVPRDGRRVAILHSTAQGISVQLELSIAGSVARMLGFTNIAAGMTPLAQSPDAAPYSMETLVQADPEVIFITSMGELDEIRAGMERMMADNPAWQAVPAVRDGRVYYLSQERFLLSPGLHYPEAVEEMAGLLYPDAVK